MTDLISVPHQGTVVLEDLDGATRERRDQLIDVIMKKCLWQFHSRAWDRLRQNENILGMVSRLLRGQAVDTTEPMDRCYWVDARYLVDSYRSRFPWLATMTHAEIERLLTAVKDHLDVLTVTSSLNEELTDQHY
jgi:nitrogenase delta subunit